jgi:GMP synthase (glutamine-hydrolysing)
MSHGDLVTKLPRGFVTAATTAHSPDAAMADEGRRLYAVQFHPEVEHTRDGVALLKNFLFAIAHCARDWDVRNLIAAKVTAIRQAVGSERVIAAVSGGVDSTVTAALTSRAIGRQLTAVFVDHGLLRQGEPAEVRRILAHLGCRVKVVNAERQFLAELRGVTFGEAKRKTIGREFIRVFDRTARTLTPTPRFLAQGTIHSDVIESAQAASGRTARVIKSHHNVGGLPKRLRWRLLEPLRDIFKDEVRELGLALGLPESLVWRQPFPGPGLAIRIAGEVTREKLAVLKHADAIVRDEVERAGRAHEFYHYFAQLLSLKTVGVTGDERKYAYPIVVRIVTSSDIMTADWGRLPHDFLARLSWRITAEVRGAVRVLYDITSKPPATTEWE